MDHSQTTKQRTTNLFKQSYSISKKKMYKKKVWAHAIPNALMILPHPFTYLCKAYYNRRYIVELVQSSWFINLCNKSIYRVFLVRGVAKLTNTPIARFMGPTWGPPGADRTQVGPMWATWTLLSGQLFRVNLEQSQMHSMVCCCSIILTTLTHISLEKNGRHFADGSIKCIFMNETFGILIQISLKFVPKAWQ